MMRPCTQRTLTSVPAIRYFIPLALVSGHLTWFMPFLLVRRAPVSPVDVFNALIDAARPQRADLGSEALNLLSELSYLHLQNGVTCQMRIVDAWRPTSADSALTLTLHASARSL